MAVSDSTPIFGCGGRGHNFAVMTIQLRATQTRSGVGRYKQRFPVCHKELEHLPLSPDGCCCEHFDLCLHACVCVHSRVYRCEHLQTEGDGLLTQGAPPPTSSSYFLAHFLCSDPSHVIPPSVSHLIPASYTHSLLW